MLRLTLQVLSGLWVSLIFAIAIFGVGIYGLTGGMTPVRLALIAAGVLLTAAIGITFGYQRAKAQIPPEDQDDPLGAALRTRFARTGVPALAWYDEAGRLHFLEDTGAELSELGSRRP